MKKKKVSILGIAILVLLFIILQSIRISVFEQTTEYVAVTTTRQTTTSTTKTIQGNCSKEDYPFAYRWVDFITDAKSGTIAPHIEIKNLFDRTATYTVQFFFIEESRYPYTQYNNQPLNAEPAFVSSIQEVIIDPQKDKTIIITTKAKNLTAVYWVFADIIPPQFEYCDTAKEVYSIPDNQEIEQLVPKTRIQEKKISLYVYLRDYLL